MSNMSYCRFQNTLSDLQDCAEAIAQGDKLSADEARAKRNLIDLCRAIVEEDDGSEHDDEHNAADTDEPEERDDYDVENMSELHGTRP